MNEEVIQVRATESGQLLDVVVFSKTANQIEVVVGSGTHSVKCQLTPTGNNAAYAGTVMGREIVYERTPDQVQGDIDALKPSTRYR